MSDPTFAEKMTQLTNAIHVFQELEEFSNADGTNLLGLLDTHDQSLEGDAAKFAGLALDDIRASVSAALSPGAVRSVLLPHLLDLGKVIAAAETDVPTLMQRLTDYFVANSKTVNRWEKSYGDPSAAGGNTGNIDILRCTENELNAPIEAGSLELKTAVCIADGRQVDVEQEVIEIRGVEAEPDFLQVLGSGQNLKRSIQVSDANESARLLGNPSFSNFTGTIGALTALTDWTVANDVTSNMTLSESVTYRGSKGDDTPRALFITANDTVSQIIENTRSSRLSKNIPYWMQVAVFPTTGTSGGNIILRMGATSRTVALTGLNANAWNIVGIVSGDPDSTCWLKTFNEANLDISVEIASLAGGTGVYIDDILFVPGKRVDNLWYWAVPSAASHVSALRLDSWTWTDSESAPGIINKWLIRGQFGYLPSATSATETEADP